MRLALRRGAAAPDPDGPDGPDGPELPEPADGPVAVFAGVPDGRWLWVAVAAQPGRLALRHTDTGALRDLPTEVVTDQPAYTAARIDLSPLDGEQARHDVVLLPPEGDGAAVAVRTEPMIPRASRPGADGRTQHLLVRSPEGLLRLRSTVLPPAAGLAAVRKLEDAVELTLLEAGPELAVLDDDRHVLASWPVDERGVVRITRAGVSGLAPGTRPLVTGRADAWLPVRRRANDLLDPRSAAPLPQLDHPTEERPLLRLPWSREAHLLMRLFPLDDTEPAP